MCNDSGRSRARYPQEPGVTSNENYEAIGVYSEIILQSQKNKKGVSINYFDNCLTLITWSNILQVISVSST